MHSLDQVSQFLGIQFIRNANGMLLSQETYAKSIIHKAGMLTCKPCTTPISTKKFSYDIDDPSFSDASFYRSIVGGLQYLTITRPDLSFAVNLVCQHMHDPKQSHF